MYLPARKRAAVSNVEVRECVRGSVTNKMGTERAHGSSVSEQSVRVDNIGGARELFGDQQEKYVVELREPSFSDNWLVSGERSTNQCCVPRTVGGYHFHSAFSFSTCLVTL
jgi:hypothetical protein